MKLNQWLGQDPETRAKIAQLALEHVIPRVKVILKRENGLLRKIIESDRNRKAQ